MERPCRTSQATEVVRGKAGAIERATSAARADEIVVAVIQKDLSSGGVWALTHEDIARQVLLVEDEGGWSLTIPANTSATQV